eukprot:scaffold164369_cov48-Cyclotella_meneghiniana.AAC.2
MQTQTQLRTLKSSRVSSHHPMHRSTVLWLGLLVGTLANDGAGVVQSFAFIQRGRSTSHNSCYSGWLQLRGGNTNNSLGGVPLKSHSAIRITTSTNVKSSRVDLEKYHLIWSPGFWKKLLLSIVFWLSLETIQSKLDITPVSYRYNTFCHDNISQSSPFELILPLLSSSCCAIQLIINAISGLGCAGFNTYLGPIRPFFLSVFGLLTWKQIQQRRPIWTAVSLILAFLPEGVFVWNKITEQHFHQTEESLPDNSQSATLPINAIITLDIPTMGCVACVNKIDSSIRGCGVSANIIDEKSWLKDQGGVAELKVSAGSVDDIDKIALEVKRAVNKAGFQCEIDSLDINSY